MKTFFNLHVDIVTLQNEEMMLNECMNSLLRIVQVHSFEKPVTTNLNGQDMIVQVYRTFTYTCI